MQGFERWAILAVLCLSRLAMAFQFQSIAALAPYLVPDLGIDYARFGLLIGLYMLPGVVVAFPGGLLGRRYGDKRVVLYGMGMMVVGGVVSGAGHLYVLSLAGRFIAGIGGVFVNVLMTKMVTDWFAGREIGTALSLLVNSWPIGIGLALVTEPGIAAAASWRAGLDATSVAALMAALLVAAVYRSPASAAPAAPDRAGAALTRRECGLASLAGLVWALFNTGYNLLLSFAPAMLIDRGLTPSDAGLATSLLTWATVLSIPLGGFVIDRVRSPTALIAASLALMGAGMFLAPLAAPAALFAAIGFMTGLPAGAIMALPAGLLRHESRGPGMGVFFTWYYVAMVVVLPLAGAFRDATGMPGAPLALGGLIEFLGVGVVIVLRLLQRRTLAPAVARR